MLILAIDYSKDFTTKYWPTKGHMTLFVVKSFNIQIYGQVMDLSIFYIASA